RGRRARSRARIRAHPGACGRTAAQAAVRARARVQPVRLPYARVVRLPAPAPDVPHRATRRLRCRGIPDRLSAAQAADDSTYVKVIEEFAAALPGASTRGVVVSSLPESLSADTRELCLARGIVPLQGQRESLEALDLAGAVGERWAAGAKVALAIPRQPPRRARSLGEHDAKRALADFGVPLPRARLVPGSEAAAAAVELGFPV